MPFFEKFCKVTKENQSYVCVGLDTDITKIPSHLKSEPNPTFTFNKSIIDQTYKYVAAYKPNFAFYIATGYQGIITLRDTIDYIPKNIPVIWDMKAGDIGNTMEQYAISCFSHFRADAMTINTLMGADVIEACLSVPESYAFVLALTSNESAKDFFYHGSLYEKIAQQIHAVGHERLGAVVGATRVSDLDTMRKLMPQSVFLVPGVGAQGGDLKSVCELAKYTAEDARLLINSSRGIIFADSSHQYANVAKNETIKLRDKINKYLGK